MVRPTIHTQLALTGGEDLALRRTATPAAIHQMNDAIKPIRPMTSNAREERQSKSRHIGIRSSPLSGANVRRTMKPMAAKIPVIATAKTGRLIFINARQPNDPGSATRPTGRNDGNHDAPAGSAAAHG